jgi:hypothetical protein
MKALHGQGSARDSCEENVEGVRGNKFLEEQAVRLVSATNPCILRNINPPQDRCPPSECGSRASLKKSENKFGNVEMISYLCSRKKKEKYYGKSL